MWLWHINKSVVEKTLEFTGNYMKNSTVEAFKSIE